MAEQSGRPQRERVDRLLVARGFFESRAQAQAAIEAGFVTVDGRVVVRKPSETAAGGAAIAAQPAFPWVSRGGVKLAHALEVFDIEVAGVEALDIGASTGGFTDVLLARGARRGTAVDVGHGQLHPRLAGDDRVTLLEGRDARDLIAGDLPAAPSLVVVDVSFIPLARVLPTVLGLAAPGATLVALVKPQFEAGPGRVGRDGVLRDAALQDEIASRAVALVEGPGWTVLGTVSSPIAGGDGNREFLLEARRG